ncbi:putative oxido [Cyphellophora attinorum]|uniref:Putative oxido n=1 Tax=Cyphellophora attinorum TaxID=1664694 RepID=A0A0N1HWB4_9EURO|nr:putative oxido [Phialophora attinorum]KPI44414.1 putative oxido [Phialophora attinorum]
MGVQFSQIIPPSAPLTEANVPSQKGKTFIGTGGYSGVGLELSRLLYNAGGHVYIAGRNQASAEKAIEEIMSTSKVPTSEQGRLEFLLLDLGDLSSIKASADQLVKKGVAVDVLFNNAGRGNVAPNSFSAQGLEVQVATNVLGAYLFTKLLEPCLTADRNADASPARVIWTASQIVDLLVPAGGHIMAHLTSPVEEQMKDLNACYTMSKLGNWYLATEYGRRHNSSSDNAVFSIAQNPGGLRSNFFRAYTALYAGLSQELSIERHQGVYVIPWGRIHPAPREDLLAAVKSEAEGGTGEAAKLWDWCEEMTKQYQ